MTQSSLRQVDEEETTTTETETEVLTIPRVHVTAPFEPPPVKNGDAKPPRRLSFHDSVGQMSLSSGGKNRMNLSRQAVNRQSKMLELPFALPPGGKLNHPDVARGVRYLSQRSSFDSPVLCQIIWVFCCIGWVTGSVEILIQLIIYLHNSLHWRWSIGFWSGGVFFTHATVGVLTLWKRVKTPLRMLLTQFYLPLSVFLSATCIAEMALAVYTYNHASELINCTLVYDEHSYRVSAREVSIFNSLLSGCGLLGILIAIFASLVTLQRLNIELKMAHSFSTLVSRRNSAVPQAVSGGTVSGGAVSGGTVSGGAVSGGTVPGGRSIVVPSGADSDEEEV